MIATGDAVWCGASNGGRRMSPWVGVKVPAIEWMEVTATASSSLRSGRIEGRRQASIVLPAPGGPIMTT